MERRRRSCWRNRANKIREIHAILGERLPIYSPGIGAQGARQRQLEKQERVSSYWDARLLRRRIQQKPLGNWLKFQVTSQLGYFSGFFPELFL